jgi:hypothetical protein
MDMTMVIRVVAGALALMVIGVIAYRRGHA